MGVEVVFKSNLSKVFKEIDKVERERIKDAVNEVRNMTQEVLAGGGSGRQYFIPGTKKLYTASSPGQPPAVATGRLRQSIATEITDGGKTGYVGAKRYKPTKGKKGGAGTNIDYGRMLEFGTKDIAARPWLRISFEKSTEAVKAIFVCLWF